MDQRPTIPSSSSHSTLCRMGCGFFGNAATEGMCSKCYRDHERRKKEQHSQAGPSRLRAPTSSPRLSKEGAVGRVPEGAVRRSQSEVHVQTTTLSDLPASFSPSSSSSSSCCSSTLSQSKSPKNRCFACRKKVGLTGFDCRCGNVFCSLHRYADTHQCTYDYKTSGREELEKKHPKIVAAKIEKL